MWPPPSRSGKRGGENVDVVIRTWWTLRDVGALHTRVARLGCLPCDGRSADLLYNVISRRHEQWSVVITTNLSFKQ